MQWIELYNSTLTSSAKGAINTIPLNATMENWFLYFVDTHNTIPVPTEQDVIPVADAAAIKVKNVVKLELNAIVDGEEQYVLVDMVSNLAGGGWTVVTADGTYGQSGKIKQSTTDATAAVDLVSMYRKINYANVEKDFAKDTAALNRTEQLKAIPGGGGSGGWAKSTRAFDNNLIGTPGARHFKGAVTIVTASSVDRTKVIVNEIGNSATAGQDWVEFRNVSGDAYNLKNHHLSYVKAINDEVSLINFKDVDVWIPKDGVMLVLASDPDVDAHPIAGGINVKDAGITWDGTAKAYLIEENTDRIPNGSQSLYYIDAANTAGFDIPDVDTLIILRNAHDKLKTDANLLDVNGGLSTPDRAATHATNLWPLKKTGGAHGNTVDGSGRKFPPGAVYQKNNAGGGTGDKHWAKRGYTGIGYKRDAGSGNAYGGTPGYDNGSEKVFDKKADHADYKAVPVTISEIMYATGNGLPQWIELYNSSLTDAVQISEWQLALENDADVPMRTLVSVKLGAKIIPPNQTVLIVASSGRNSGEFPSSRVLELWSGGLADGQRDKLEIIDGTSRRNFRFLSQTAFKVTLMDKGGVVVDVAGNMGADPAWDLPMAEDGRSSLIRRYDDGVERDGTMLGDGTVGSAGWVLASDSPLGGAQQDTYYGSREDLGTPGYHGGGALPVSLSKFRPERLDSGEIVVRWITESELNNAGFNILRSDARDGEFTKLNTKLIAGQGTTSERTVYSFPDTSAKPNVVYYYQIQDVSLDGKVQTLRQSRIKGYVSPSGKLTTTWGDLKLQD